MVWGQAFKWEGTEHLILFVLAPPLWWYYAPHLGACADQPLHPSFCSLGAAAVQVFADEKAAAAARVEAHWREVRRKQDEAKDLRRQVATFKAKHSRLKQRRQSLTAERDEHEHNWREWQEVNSRLKGVVREISSLGVSISNCESKLRATLEAPAPVVQPLPQDRDSAASWLFFLHMVRSRLF